ncbi:hypothetical protein RUM44_012003 [Polyplax serrata]|uniref:Uncharacterized protein n=1 Tax=Polyplax serrata TaxID=468196 RepID=A0ABR1BEB5_POLSC
MAKELPEVEEKETVAFLRRHLGQPALSISSDEKGKSKSDTGTGNHVARSEKLQWAEHSVVLRFCDCLFLTTIVQVNVVGFWRGLFGILSFVHELSHLSLIFLFGGMVQFHFTAWRNSYRKHLQDHNRTHAFLRKIYVYTSGSAEVLLWAGLWAILDELDVRQPLLQAIICYIILVSFRFSKNLLAPPCCVTTDPSPEELFEFETAFKTSIKKNVSATGNSPLILARILSPFPDFDLFL